MPPFLFVPAEGYRTLLASVTEVFMSGIDRNFPEDRRPLDELVTRFVDCRFQHAADLWAIQFDLVKFQIKVKERLAASREEQGRLRKEATRIALAKNQDWQPVAKSLQLRADALKDADGGDELLYALGRRFGDAFAWVLLGSDKRMIEPLSNNAPNPPIPRGHSLRGMLAIAEIFHDAGIGFPILHDLTNILRVGDMTFVKPLGKPVTIEVKTYVFGQEGDSIQATVEVSSALDPSEQHELLAKLDDALARRPRAAEPLYAPPIRNRRDLKHQRQLDRLGVAKALQEGRPVSEDGLLAQAPIEVVVEEPHHHWEEAERILRAAKESGYAGTAVEQAFYYFAIYSPKPFIAPAACRTELGPTLCPALPHDLVNSGIFFQDRSLNVPWMVGSIDHLSQHPPLNVRPLRVHPYPTDIVMDLVSGRLMLFVMVNLGRIVEALRAAGYSARICDDKEQKRGGILMMAKSRIDNLGRETTLRFMERGKYLKLVGYECLSVSGYVNTASSILEAMFDRAIADSASAPNECNPSPEAEQSL